MPRRGNVASKNPWMTHLQEYRSSHPGLPLKTCMREASDTYRAMRYLREKLSPATPAFVTDESEVYKQYSDLHEMKSDKLKDERHVSRMYPFLGKENVKFPRVETKVSDLEEVIHEILKDHEFPAYDYFRVKYYGAENPDAPNSADTFTIMLEMSHKPEPGEDDHLTKLFRINCSIHRKECVKVRKLIREYNERIKQPQPPPPSQLPPRPLPPIEFSNDEFQKFESDLIREYNERIKQPHHRQPPPPSQLPPREFSNVEMQKFESDLRSLFPNK